MAKDTKTDHEKLVEKQLKQQKKEFITEPKNLEEAIKKEYGQTGQKMPEWLGFLIEEVEKKSKGGNDETGKLKKEVSELKKQVTELKKQLTTLKNKK